MAEGWAGPRDGAPGEISAPSGRVLSRYIRPSMLQHLLRRLVFDVPILNEFAKMPLKVRAVLSGSLSFSHLHSGSASGPGGSFVSATPTTANLRLRTANSEETN